MPPIARVESIGYPHNVDKEKLEMFREHILTGRPLGETKFIDELGLNIGRILRKSKPGSRKR